MSLSQFQLCLEPLPYQCSGIIKWCLDFPKGSEQLSATQLLEEGVMFQGWVLPQSGVEVVPYLRIGDQFETMELNVERPDVVERVLGESSEKHPSLLCGFRYQKQIDQAESCFGIRVNGHDHELIQLEVVPVSSVLEGEAGWLFLDNDTNGSVDQFRGRRLIDRAGLKEWKAYLSGLNNLAERTGVRHAVQIAPTKESVLSNYYPYPRGRKTPMDQVMALAVDYPVVHPVGVLQEAERPTFRVCDTHWTHWGAWQALLQVAASLGVDTQTMREHFASDRYTQRELSGDLGNKLFPPRSSLEWVLTGWNYRRCLLYDNGFPNMGRVLVTQNPEALCAAKCLIFGSSSSYTQLNYLARLFSDVTFVHSAGHVDVRLLEEECPDYLICQTNGRFVVQPPTLELSLYDEMRSKWDQLKRDQQVRFITEQKQWVNRGLFGSALRLHAIQHDLPGFIVLSEEHL